MEAQNSTRIIKVTIAVILALIIIVAGFSLFRNKSKSPNRNALVVQQLHLLKTKLALVEYMRLEENDPDYATLKAQIDSRLKSVRKEGENHLSSLTPKDIPGDLITKTRITYKDQVGLLEKKDEEIIDHLVVLTNLLRQYQLEARKYQ